MSTKNRTIATEFILLGFSSDLRINTLLFVLFLDIYAVIIGGNGLIVWVILRNPQLHIPMYFFLCILSFLDLYTSTAVVPRLLSDLFSSQRIISYGACAVQVYTVLLTGGTEYLLLAVMAYDRYVAICRPLHYPVMMSWRTCYGLTAFMWAVSISIVIPFLCTLFDMCYPNQINHFMCEGVGVRLLACDGVFLFDILTFMTCFFIVFLPFTCVIVSYACIISSILKVHSTGRSKAFSTCSSHITVVVLAYGSTIIMYFGQSSQYSIRNGKYITLFSLIICPLLNPLIYSLNNKDVKEAIKKNCLTLSRQPNVDLRQAAAKRILRRIRS